MNSNVAISCVCNQLSEKCADIINLGNRIALLNDDGNAKLEEDFTSMRLDTLEDIQRLTLTLTEMLTQDTATETNTDDDGSVFSNGELNAVECKESEDK